MISRAANPQDIQARNLRLYAYASIVIDVGVFLLSGYLGYTVSPLLYISGSVFLAAAILAIVALRLEKQRKTIAGAWCLLIGYSLGAISAAAVLSNIGPMTGMVILLIDFFIAMQTMPAEQGRWGFVAGALASVITSLVVFFPPFPPADLAVDTSSLVLWIGRVTVLGFIAIILSQYRTLSLNNKILAAFLSIVVLIILAITAVLEITTSNTATAQIGRELNDIAHTRGNSLGDHLNAQIDHLRTLALDETIRREIALSNASYTGNDAVDLTNIIALDEQWKRDMQNNGMSAFISERTSSILAYRLRAFRELHPSFIDLIITDEKGALVSASTRPPIYYYGNEIWWQSTLREDRQVYIGTPEFDDNLGTLKILLAVPIYNQDSGALIGVLRCTLNMTTIVADIQTPIGETGEADILFPETGQLIHQGSLETAEPELLEAIQTVQSQLYGLQRYHGVESIVAAAAVTTSADQPAINNAGWVTVVHQTRDEALTSVQRQIGTLSFFGTIMLGIASLLSLVLAQPLVKPIADLTRVAGEIANGNLSARAPIETRDEIGALAETFNGMTTQLQDTLTGLEQRVSERTAALEASSHQLQRRSSQLQTIAEVSQTIAAIQEIDTLLSEVTRLVSERFGHYHVGIFLLDEKNEYAVLRAANSEGGQKMLARRHRLRVGQEGVVGFSISQKYPHIALDVGEDAIYFSNPDLPNTHSEISLPLIIAGRVIGAMDVQSERVGAFTSEDSEVLTTLANQVAVAIENTRLFAESRQALAELDKTFQRYIQGEWQQMSTITELHGYQANETGLTPLVHTRKQATRGRIPALEVPIRLRGVTIGTLAVQTNKALADLSEDEIAIAQATAERVALALENARLIEQSQRRATKERTIGEIAARIGSLVDIDNILQTAAQEMGRIIPGAEVTIQMQGEE